MVLRWITSRLARPSAVSRVLSSDQAARIATAEALPPNTVSRWLMLGASGARSTTSCDATESTDTAMAFERGMWSWR